MDIPIWYNKGGDVVLDEMNEMDGYGYKVDITINRPDMAIVMDKVGCNISQEMDHAIGGQHF